jgi:ribosome recycling factor
MNEVLKDVERRMVGAVDAFKDELSALRVGRATLAIVDGVHVDYYGTPTPLNQVANLSVPDPTTITIAPWEPKLVGDIERAILKANLGVTPSNDGKLIRLNIPPLTEERRHGLVKIAHDHAENSRNAVRQVRRDGNDRFKKMEKDKELSEDQMHDAQERVQKLTDTYVGKINDVLSKKESEILEV